MSFMKEEGKNVQEISQKSEVSAKEEKILAFWEQNKIGQIAGAKLKDFTTLKEEAIYTLALNSIPGIGNVLLKQLVDYMFHFF